MSFRDSPHYQEAQARLQRKRTSKTPLGRIWQHQQYMAALRALLGNDNKRGRR